MTHRDTIMFLGLRRCQGIDPIDTQSAFTHMDTNQTIYHFHFLRTPWPTWMLVCCKPWVKFADWQLPSSTAYQNQKCRPCSSIENTKTKSKYISIYYKHEQKYIIYIFIFQSKYLYINISLSYFNTVYKAVQWLLMKSNLILNQSESESPSSLGASMPKISLTLAVASATLLTKEILMLWGCLGPVFLGRDEGAYPRLIWCLVWYPVLNWMVKF